MRGEIDVVLFDNDGILVDSEPLFLRATQEILAEVGIDLDAATFHDLSMRRGRSVFELCETRGLGREAIAALRERRARRYDVLIDEGVRILDGVVETLERLHGRRPMAIVTSSSPDHFDRIHRQTGLLRYFEFALTSVDYTHHKPHPEPYRLAAERLGVPPSRCLVVEDTERGLVAARAAGMRCVVVPHALTRTGDFTHAAHVLPSLHPLADLLALDAAP